MHLYLHQNFQKINQISNYIQNEEEHEKKKVEKENLDLDLLRIKVRILIETYSLKK